MACDIHFPSKTRTRCQIIIIVVYLFIWHLMKLQLRCVGYEREMKMKNIQITTVDTHFPVEITHYIYIQFFLINILPDYRVSVSVAHLFRSFTLVKLFIYDIGRRVMTPTREHKTHIKYILGNLPQSISYTYLSYTYSHSDSSSHLPPQLPFPFPNPTKPNKCALFISSLGFRLLVLLLVFYDCLLFCCTRPMFMPYPNIVEPSYAYLFLHGAFIWANSMNTATL